MLLQWEGRTALQRCWWTMLVMRGFGCTIPANVHKTMFTAPFLRCFKCALDSALAHPVQWLPAFIPDVISDVAQRDYLRLYRQNGQAVYSNPNFVGKQTSILRILSCLHSDGAGYFASLHALLCQAGCNSKRSQTEDACSLDSEVTKQGARVCKLIEEAVSGAVEARPCRQQGSNTLNQRCLPCND